MMKALSSLLMTGLFLLFSLGSTQRVWAEVAEGERLKREAYHELDLGIKQFKSGDLKKGIYHYERAYRLVPNDKTLFTIAKAYSKLKGVCHKSLQAWDRLRLRCVSCSLKAEVAQGYQEAQATCNVKLSLNTPAPGVQVLINSENYGVTPLAVYLPASTYQIELQSKEGEVLFTSKVELKEKSARRTLDFVDLKGRLTLKGRASSAKKTARRNKKTARQKASARKQVASAKGSKGSSKTSAARLNKGAQADKTDDLSAATASAQAGAIKTEQHQMDLKSGSERAQSVVVNASLQCQTKSKFGGYLPYPDCNGATLKAEDRFRVVLSSPNNAFIYLFLTNDHGDRVMLFPDPGIDNHVKQGVEYVIPGQDWYELDENGGVQEQIRLIASLQPIPALEQSRGIDMNTKAIEMMKKMSFRGVRKTRLPAKLSQRLKELDTVMNVTGDEKTASVSFEIEHE